MRYSSFLLLIFFFAMLGPDRALAQPAKNYPKGYFVNPLDIPISLSGNFGELRPNHFHMGLDLRTNKKENLPIYAAAAGYIAKIKIEPYGFGRALYINHPNGLTTLYAHLNDFAPEIEAWVKKKQYELKSWAIFVDLPPDALPVSQKQFIAYSGNTGGSQAPHLHFEIRDTKSEKVLNPMLFGFPIADNVPPDLLRLAVYDRCKSTYEQNPKIYPLKKSGGVYVPVAGGLLSFKTERISFAISAYDRQTGSSNSNGIYSATLKDDEKNIVSFEMDSIGYDETRYFNAHIDYKYKAGGGSYLQHLSVLPGNACSNYRKTGGDGVIELSDYSLHQIAVEVKDAYGNLSTIRLAVRMDTPIVANYTDSLAALRTKRFFPGYVNLLEREDFECFLPETCIYDSITPTYYRSPGSGFSAIHTLHNTLVPIHSRFTVRIKPSQSVPPALRERMLIQRSAGSRSDVLKAEWQGEWLSAKFRDFGSFRILTDTVPPKINPLGWKEAAILTKQNRLLISVKDDLGDIKNFRAELDGEWLRFTNDKAGAFVYKFDERCLPGLHQLKIYAEDEAGNAAEKVFSFTR